LQTVRKMFNFFYRAFTFTVNKISRAGTLPVVFVLVGAIGVFYIWSSRSNPRVTDLTINVVALGIFIGIVSSAITSLFDSQLKAHGGKAVIISLSCAVLIVASLVRFSNSPQDLNREIRVTYLVNVNTKELPSTLYWRDSTAGGTYRDAVMIFSRFRRKNAENSQKVDELLNSNGAPVGASWKIFPQLTEYLTPYFMGSNFSSEDDESFGQTFLKSMGLPDPSIVGQPVSMAYIAGDLYKNPFYGIEGVWSANRIQLRLPKETVISFSFRGDDKNSYSRFVLHNGFLDMTVEVQPLLLQAGAFAILDPNAFYPALPFGHSPFADEIESDRKARFKRYDVVLQFQVVFDKLWYGSPAMRLYEEWANDFISALERKFRWGHPTLLDFFDVMRNVERQRNILNGISRPSIAKQK
jgi:hypothetical protein